MKKAKFMLASIAVVGVVGSAIAVKANHRGSFAYCYTTNLLSPICDTKIDHAEIGTAGGCAVTGRDGEISK